MSYLKHKNPNLIAILFLLFPTFLTAKPLLTPYGSIEVEDKIIWELIQSEPMQRLKLIRQYGVGYYTKDREEYTRFQHSLGVFALLKINNAPLKEQIAGLLHDVSHTAFSHMGDFYFEHDNLKESFQDTIHSWFLKRYGLDTILEKHGFSISEVHPKNPKFRALDSELPNLSADRLDYNLQGAFRRGWITEERMHELVKSTYWDGEQWIMTDFDGAKMLANFSLHMTEHCWGGPLNSLSHEWLVLALKEAMKIGIISKEDIYFGTDEEIWTLLKESNSRTITDCIDAIENWEDRFIAKPFTDGNQKITNKFRGIDPILHITDYKKRLSEMDEGFFKQFSKVKERVARGWQIILTQKNAQPSAFNK